MKKFGLIFVGMLAGVILVIGILWVGSIGNAQAEKVQLSAVSTPTPSLDESGAAPLSRTASQNDEIPSGVKPLGVQAPIALPTPIPGETLVYFVPTDNDATATVLYLYNTDSVPHTVALRGFNYDGAMVYALNINVGATSFLRLVSDSVAAAPPPSWATPAPITTNFTDFVYFASFSLPKGVKVEGYTVYNPGTGTIDPRLDQGGLPIRFSTDPATLFLPLQNTP